MSDNARSIKSRGEHRWPVFVTAFFASVLAMSAPVFASSPSFTGTYVLDQVESDDLFEVMAPVLDQMNVVKRMAARHILRSRVMPDLKLIRIDQSPTAITILDGNRPSISVPGNGREIDHRTERGKMVKLSGQVDDRVFQAKMVGEKGIYQAHSNLSPDAERLHVFVNLALKDYSKPVIFKLVYARRAG